MKDGPETSADHILESLSSTYQQSIDKDAETLVRDDLLPEELAEAIAADSDVDTVSSTGNGKGRKEKITKRPVHDFIGLDLWELGTCEFVEKDIVLIREEAVKRRLLKIEVRGCIFNHIHENSGGADIDLRSSLSYMTSWQLCVRGRKNNLRLK